MLIDAAHVKFAPSAIKDHIAKQLDVLPIPGHGEFFEAGSCTSVYSGYEIEDLSIERGVKLEVINP